MDAFELHDLLAENRQLISETYNFFLTVQLAIFGIVFIARGGVSLKSRFVICLGYLGFCYINFMAQTDNYTQQDLLITQIMALPDTERNVVAKTLVGSPEMPWIFEHLSAGYIAVAAVSCLIILLSGYLRD